MNGSGIDFLRIVWIFNPLNWRNKKFLMEGHMGTKTGACLRNALSSSCGLTEHRLCVRDIWLGSWTGIYHQVEKFSSYLADNGRKMIRSKPNFKKQNATAFVDQINAIV